MHQFLLHMFRRSVMVPSNLVDDQQTIVARHDFSSRRWGIVIFIWTGIPRLSGLYETHLLFGKGLDLRLPANRIGTLTMNDSEIEVFAKHFRKPILTGFVLWVSSHWFFVVTVVKVLHFVGGVKLYVPRFFVNSGGSFSRSRHASCD